MKPGMLIGKQIGLFSTAMALLLLLTGCQGQGGEETASVRLSLDLSGEAKPAKAAQAPAPSGITSVQVEVTGSEMDPLSLSVDVTPNAETTVALDIPAGPARRFVVTAFDAEGTARFRGEATVDLEPGSSPNITINMVPLDISVPPGPIPSIQISPRTAVVPKDTRPRFSVSGIDLSQVQWEVTSAAGNDPKQVGSVATDGDYTPPATILTDGATPLGNPIPITVTAINRNTPTVRDSATVTLTTGSTLKFEKNQRVTPSSGSVSTQSSGQRSVAFHQGKGYAVWSNGTQILFSESADGTNWTNPPDVITFNESGVASPSLAISSEGSVYVAFLVCPSCTATTIQLATRPFSGEPFKSIPLDIVGSSPQDPAVAVSPSGVAFVAWSDTIPNTRTGRDIYLQRVPKDSEASRIHRNTNLGSINLTRPAISISNSGEVFLTWEATDPQIGPTDIFGTASTDAGDSFLPEVQINLIKEFDGETSNNPTIAAGPNGTVYVAWELDDCGECLVSIYFNVGKLGSSGLEFRNRRRLGDAIKAIDQFSPSIAWDGANGIYIAFHERVSSIGDEIFLAKSKDEGESFFFSPISRDDSSFVPTRSFPSLAVDGAGRAFAIWTDGRRDPQGLTDVFFAKGE